LITALGRLKRFFDDRPSIRKHFEKGAAMHFICLQCGHLHEPMGPRYLSIAVVVYSFLPKNFDGIGVKDNIFPHPVLSFIRGKNRSAIFYSQKDWHFFVYFLLDVKKKQVL
jgi:hypothetical protein